MPYGSFEFVCAILKHESRIRGVYLFAFMHYQRYHASNGEEYPLGALEPVANIGFGCSTRKRYPSNALRKKLLSGFRFLLNF